MNKKIVFICGVSGSGKGTVINALLNTGKFKYFPSYVTRDIRPGEISGERYIFISNEEFKKSLEKNEFLEYNLVHNQNKYYGTKKDIINGLKGDKIPLKEVDMIGLEKMIRSGEIKDKFLSIFLDVSNETMVKRIHKRGAPISDEELEKRLASAKIERKLAEKFSTHIVNIDGGTESENINKVTNILKKENII